VVEVHRPDPGNNRQETWTAFEGLAKDYDRWYRTPLGTLVDTLEKNAIFSLADVKDGEEALDVGCGTGNYSLELARRGARVQGIDPSNNMLEIARRKAQEQGLPVEFRHGFVEDLPFADQTFDIITCVTVLEFTASPAQAVAEMARLLKPGGRLVVGVLNTWSIWAIARRLERKETIYSRAHFFSPLEMVTLLRPYGNVKWQTAVFVPPWYARQDPRIARGVGLLGRILLKPFGAFIAARVAKEQ